MDDLISRQDTIDRINEYIEEYSEIDPDGNHSEKWCAMQEAKMTIENMPSAQPKAMPSPEPEIIHCKECRYHGTAICRIWSRYGTINVPGYGFCYRAERKEQDEGD